MRLDASDIGHDRAGSLCSNSECEPETPSATT